MATENKSVLEAEMSMKKLTLCVLTFALLCLPSYAAAKEFPREAIQALRSPEIAILFSLEPEDRSQSRNGMLQGFKVLGKTDLTKSQARLAANAFLKAAKDWDGSSVDCFNPRVALRISYKDHTFDFLLCYECEELEVYKDGTVIVSLGASGSPNALNSILAAAHVPLSKSGLEK